LYRAGIGVIPGRKVSGSSGRLDVFVGQQENSELACCIDNNNNRVVAGLLVTFPRTGGSRPDAP
jgi:hypothetical protein